MDTEELKQTQETGNTEAETGAQDNAAKAAPEGAETLSGAALERLLAEAEERGYRRGRNENISVSMEQWETSVDLAPDLLLNPRKSLWD